MSIFFSVPVFKICKIAGTSFWQFDLNRIQYLVPGKDSIFLFGIQIYDPK